MFSKYPEYFLQTKSWAEYWKKANLAGHEYFEFSSTNGLSCIVYQYPWHLGEKFWYVPKGPVAKSKMNISDLTRDFKELVYCIIDQAKKQNVAFIKWDFDDSFCEQIGYQNNSELLQDLKILLAGQDVRKSKKILQYLKAIVLEPKIETLDQNSEKYDIETLNSFFLETKAFWSTTNENIRRYTKKSLNQGWRVAISKTPQNFEAFWQVYQSTSDRQKFSTHHKSNMKVLFEQDFSRLIVLYDPHNQPQAAWMGLVSEQTLTYLYGGNTQLSFAGYGQYLVHLVAIKMLATEDLKYYDLGKYDELHGYSAFKKGYRGEIRVFLGPADIVLKPWKYKLINFLIGMRKLFSQSPN